jgi:histidine decarboxylase
MLNLDEYYEKVKNRSSNYIGYPAAVDYNYKDIYRFLDFSLNNVGDPFVQSNDMHSKEFEREVISFFA